MYLDTFLSTLVFLLPGLMLYFWLQSFGINPVVKHNPAEFSAISALLWFPVSFTTLFFINIFHQPNIKTIASLMDASKKLSFLSTYLLLSVFISLLAAAIWAKWGHRYIFLFIINAIRKWRGAAPYSQNPSVWDEAFLNNGSQIVEVSKIGDKEYKLVGELEKVSRPFEPGRDLLLRHMDYWEAILGEYEVEIINTFVDTKSGIIIKIYNPQIAKMAHDMYKQKHEISSSVSEQSEQV